MLLLSPYCRTLERDREMIREIVEPNFSELHTKGEWANLNEIPFTKFEKMISHLRRVIL